MGVIFISDGAVFVVFILFIVTGFGGLDLCVDFSSVSRGLNVMSASGGHTGIVFHIWVSLIAFLSILDFYVICTQANKTMFCCQIL